MSSLDRQLLRIFLVCGTVAIAACSLVDEDLRDCPPPSPTKECELDYTLQLVTNMTTELTTQLSMETDIRLSSSLKTHLSSVFTDFAHDVDLSFYDVQGDSSRLHHEAHIMDASQSSYTLSIPVRDYMHLALANLEENPQLTLAGDDKCHRARIGQELKDTVDSHRSGIFTARLPMDMREGEDQQFDVHLYMANCASALVMDTVGVHCKDVRVFVTGFANSFSLADSTYHFDHPSVVRTQQVEVKDDPTSPLCFSAVTFPSREEPQSKVVIETEEPFESEAANQALWQVQIYITTEDGSVTQSVLGIRTPLRPGQFKLIRCRVQEDGRVDPEDTTVAVVVHLNWSPGSQWDVIM